MTMDTLRKGFYVLDLLILAVLLVCVIHTVVYDKEWGFLILDAALLLRFNSTFLLYRKEKMSILPIVAFTLLFGFAVLSGTFENTIIRMSEYPIILSEIRSNGVAGEVRHLLDMADASHYICSSSNQSQTAEERLSMVRFDGVCHVL